jgi:hypothetical protein
VTDGAPRRSSSARRQRVHGQGFLDPPVVPATPTSPLVRKRYVVADAGPDAPLFTVARPYVQKAWPGELNALEADAFNGWLSFERGWQTWGALSDRSRWVAGQCLGRSRAPCQRVKRPGGRRSCSCTRANWLLVAERRSRTSRRSSARRGLSFPGGGFSRARRPSAASWGSAGLASRVTSRPPGFVALRPGGDL